MSWFKSGGAASGFSFEDKVSHLLENLNFNTRYHDLEYGCLKCSHQKNTHEIDLWVEFFDSCGQQVPRYAGEGMIVSCKKTLKDDTDVCDAKKNLLEAIECHKSHSSFDSVGLIATSSSLPSLAPDLGDDVFFWDLRRCSFYAWKSFWSHSEKMNFNSHENSLDKGNSFIFLVDDPQKIGLNLAECHIFSDQTTLLDGAHTERILKQILNVVTINEWLLSGKILVKIHTMNGFVSNIFARKAVLERRVSTSDIQFEIQNIFDYTMVPWEPLVFP